MEIEVLESHNQEHGFWGTTRLDYEEEETQKRWNLAFATLSLLSGKEAEEIREFLDSRIGRHIADDCFDKDVKQAIAGNVLQLKTKVRLVPKQLTRLQAKSMSCSTLSRIRTVFIKTMQCALIGMKRFIISGLDL